MTKEHYFDKYRFHECTKESNSVRSNPNLQEDYAEINLAEGDLIPDTESTLDTLTAMQMFRKGSR